MRELGIVEDGAVLIAGGKIVAVGTTDDNREARTGQRRLTRSTVAAKSYCRALSTPTLILYLPHLA